MNQSRTANTGGLNRKQTKEDNEQGWWGKLINNQVTRWEGPDNYQDKPCAQNKPD